MFRARCRRDGSVVVIKQIPLAGLSEADRMEALNESRLLAAAEHPNVVKHLESRVESDNLLIVMPHAGVDLAQHARRALFCPPRSVFFRLGWPRRERAHE